MLRLAVFFLPVMLLAACGEGATDEDPVDMDQINRNALGPVQQIELEPLTFSKLSEFELFGAGCNFTPDDKDTLVFVADAIRAHFILDGDLVGMASDSGSDLLPFGARTEYDGLSHSAEIWLAEETRQEEAPEVVHYRGTLEIKDSQERIAFSATGQWECGA